MTGIPHLSHGNGIALGQFKHSVSTNTATDAATETPVEDEVALSGEAQEFVGDGPTETFTIPGKSKAHQAMAFLRENPELADMPFGKIVSTLAKGGSLEDLLPPVEEEAEGLGEDPAAVGESSEPEEGGEEVADVTLVQPAAGEGDGTQSDAELALSMLTEIAESNAETESPDLVLEIPSEEEKDA